MLGFLLSNWKTIGYAAVAIVTAVFLFNVYIIVTRDAKNQVLIEQYKRNEVVYQETIKNKDRIIEIQKNVVQISNEVVVARDEKVEEITKKYETIVDEVVADDLNDVAADSLREVIKKLKETRPEGK